MELPNHIPTHCDLTIILVNFNGESWLEQLLPQLERYVRQLSSFQVDVVVVDNGSTDQSLALLEQWSWVKVIKSADNNGFAHGNNLALKTCHSKYAFLLNTDTSIPPDSNPDILVNYLEHHPDTAVVTPRLLLGNGSLDSACHRGEPTFWASFTYVVGLERMFPKTRCFGAYHQGWKDLKTLHAVDACSGAAMVVRTSAIEQVGLLDERFFMYAEDLDWCRRFRESGYQIIYNPEVTIVHYKYQSGLSGKSSKTRSNTRDWFYRTMLQYYDKYHTNSQLSPFRLLLKIFIRLKCRGKAGK